jgi:O-antigen/teichoic acid export membrane protein
VVTASLRSAVWSAGRRVTGLTAASALAQLAVGALYVFGARALGPASFGRVAMVLAACLMLGATFDFGLNQWLTREVAAGRLTTLAAGSLVARKRVLAVGLIAFIATTAFVVYREPVQPILLGLLAWSLWESQTGAAALRAQHRLRTSAITQVVGRMLGLAVGVPLMAVRPEIGLVVGCLLGYVMEAVPAQFAAKFIQRPGASRALWSAQRESIGFGLGTLAWSAQQLAIPLVTLGAGAHAAGIYAAAARFITPLNLLSSAMASVSVPSLARAQGSRDALRIEERKTLVMAGLFALGPTAAAVLGPFVLPVLLGPAFGESGLVFAVLGIGMIISTVNQGCMSIIQNWGRQGAVAMVYACAVTVGLAATLPLAAAGGAAVAAWASVGTQLVVSAGLCWNLSRRDRVRRTAYELLAS